MCVLFGTRVRLKTQDDFSLSLRVLRRTAHAKKTFTKQQAKEKKRRVIITVFSREFLVQGFLFIARCELIVVAKYIGSRVVGK